MNIIDPSDDDRAAWTKWVSERPEKVRQVIEKHDFRPWVLYRMKSTNHRVTIAAVDEAHDDTVTMRVDVSKEYNLVVFERQVFGVSPDDLEECDLPGADEPRGSFGLGVSDARVLLCNNIRCGLLETDPAWPVETPASAREWLTKNAHGMNRVAFEKAEQAIEHWARIEKAAANDARAEKEPLDG